MMEDCAANTSLLEIITSRYFYIDRYWHAVTLLQARPILKLFFRALVLVLIALHSATLATPATLATLPHLQHPWSSIEERHAEDHLTLALALQAGYG